MTIENTYKYLGTSIGAIDNKNNKINDDITSKPILLSTSALKLQQKIFILQNSELVA